MPPTYWRGCRGLPSQKGRRLRREKGPARAVRAVAADRATARMLDVPPNTACLVVERRTWSGGLPVTRVRLTYPGTSHAVVARFTPEG